MSDNPFDYLKSIQSTKIDMIRGSDNPELAEKGYLPFIMNKGLSYYVDSILYANEMNTRHYLSSAMQYGYYINTVRSMKRPYSWPKKIKGDEDIQFLRDHYKVNIIRAKEIYSIIGPEKVNEIKKSIIQGGIVSGKKKIP